jgi:hypothetical protein
MNAGRTSGGSEAASISAIAPVSSDEGRRMSSSAPGDEDQSPKGGDAATGTTRDGEHVRQRINDRAAGR